MIELTPVGQTVEKRVERAELDQASQAGQKRFTLFSGRFDGGAKEQVIRSVYLEVRAAYPRVNPFIVDASVGQSFADQTLEGVANMVAMVSFCWSDYGEQTRCMYSSYYEIKSAYERRIPVIPLKFCKEWPPAGGNEQGRAINLMAFSQGVVYSDYYQTEIDYKKIAKDIAQAFDSIAVVDH